MASHVEQTRLQAIRRAVDLLERAREIGVRLDGDDGRENLLTIHLHVGLGAGEYGGLEDGAFAIRTTQDARRPARLSNWQCSGCCSTTNGNGHVVVTPKEMLLLCGAAAASS